MQDPTPDSPPSLWDMSFSELIRVDEELIELRRHYATLPADERRKAAEWEYDSASASFLFGQAVGQPDLLDQDDCANAERLYAAAVTAHPKVALYHAGLGYCAGRSGRKDEAVVHARRAVELESDNYRHLSDLGWSLIEAGDYDEAKMVLERAVALAPPDYQLAKGNLDYLQTLRR